ncbi:uncharacterized protein DNG_04701 [Cephalotrichum gorgonifer]|uniref:Uncharacterized protein n=1 Tax=Cephalotrichum gorgonifer TaxID=2041049 RepID=A0AAE8MXP7_9PEZI|nr:uncharacterized protein DNG_04701 [Cephalotrichum gorgonifer]
MPHLLPLKITYIIASCLSEVQGGQDRDTLKRYKFTPKAILKSAWETQRLVRTFGPNRPDVFSRLANAVVGSGDDPSADMFIQWTIPVCDWDSLTEVEPPECLLWDCLIKKVLRTCREIYYSPTEGFQYYDF